MAQDLQKRRKIPKHLRVQVLARDNYRCRMCGRGPEVVRLHVDHVIALANGGTDEIDNLSTLCDDCNIGKCAYRFRDYRDIHVRAAAIVLDVASLFAYVNAHTRPTAIARRIASRRQLEFKPLDSDCVWLFELAGRLEIPTVRALDDIVCKNAELAERLTDYLIPRQPIEPGFVMARVFEIEAMERNGLEGLNALLSSLRWTTAGTGYQAEIFHAYKQIKS